MQHLSTFSADLALQAIDKYKNVSGGNWKKYIQMVSDIRTVCPLVKRAQDMRQYTVNTDVYVATQERSSSKGNIADGYSDIEAILGNYQTQNENQKKFVENMQTLLYRFVKNNIMPSDKEYGIKDRTKWRFAESDFTNSEEGSGPHKRGFESYPEQYIYIINDKIRTKIEYFQCDFWLKSEVYPHYSRID